MNALADSKLDFKGFKSCLFLEIYQGFLKSKCRADSDVFTRRESDSRLRDNYLSCLVIYHPKSASISYSTFKIPDS